MGDVDRLKGAQERLKEAFFSATSGLFVADSVPGAGKSFLMETILALDVISQFSLDERRPELRIMYRSFTRSEASDLAPGLCDRLEELVRNDVTPAAAAISETELRYLKSQIQKSSNIGTVDSQFRDILSEQEVLESLGFDEMPVVDSEALMQEVHDACFARVTADSDLDDEIEVLESSYDGDDTDLDTMLEEAIKYCRNRRLETAELREQFEAVRRAVYGPDEPESFDDIESALVQYVSCPFAERVSNSVERKEDLRDADQELYRRWGVCIEAFEAVLEAYRDQYRRELRECGVVSHTDVAYLVDKFGRGAADVDDEVREQVLDRYRDRIEVVAIDEIQDISMIQHDALSHIVTQEMKVLGTGQALQSVYGFRDAKPGILKRATTEGKLFDVNWEDPAIEQTNTTYRMSATIATVFDEICAEAMEDPARGNAGDLDVEYPTLESYRGDVQGSGPHVIAYDGNNYPDVKAQATAMVETIVEGLADGTFRDDDGNPETILILSRFSWMLDIVEEKLQKAGVPVYNGSGDLFDSDVVRTVYYVVRWLGDPTDAGRVRELLDETDLGLGHLPVNLPADEWSVEAVLADENDPAPPPRLTTEQREPLQGLRALKQMRDAFANRPAHSYVEDVIEQLALRADPHDRFESDGPAQRVANLDALVASIKEWEQDENFGPGRLADLMEPMVEDSNDGPSQPSAVDIDPIVRLDTCHSSKGSEAEHVGLLGAGSPVYSPGVQESTLVTRGAVAGLAPPTDVDTLPRVNIPGYDGGLYGNNHEKFGKLDNGLRWATARWCDYLGAGSDRAELAGPDLLQCVAANERAEEFRLLYVALSRAEDTLLLPLRKGSRSTEPRDHWQDTIREGLDYDGGTDSYVLSPRRARQSADPVQVTVHESTGIVPSTQGSSSDPSDTASTPPRRAELDKFAVRFPDPSRIYGLCQDDGETVLDYLLGRSSQHGTGEIDAADLPLTFDELGPAEVGTVIDDGIGTVINSHITEMNPGSSDDLKPKFKKSLRDELDGVDAAETQGVIEFFEDYVFDDLMESEMMKELQTAETVEVGKDVDGYVTVDGEVFEPHGEADIFAQFADGRSKVWELKIALTVPDEQTRIGHRIQAAVYAHLLERERSPDLSIGIHVERFGVVNESFTYGGDATDTVEQHFARLLDEEE